MEELFTALEELKKKLDQLDCIKDAEKNKNNIINNKELKKKIEQYHLEPKEELKYQIYEFQEFKNYKKNENDINFLILEINKKLSEITNQRSCSNENH